MPSSQFCCESNRTLTNLFKCERQIYISCPEKRLRKQVSEYPKCPHSGEGRVKRGNLLFSEIAPVRIKELG